MVAQAMVLDAHNSGQLTVNCTPPSGHAGSVSGVVTDGVSGVAPPVSLVELTQPGVGPVLAGTDVNGLYAFLGLPPGAYSLRVLAPNYSPAVHDPVIVNAGQHTEVNIRLVPPVPLGAVAGIVKDALTGDAIPSRVVLTLAQNGEPLPSLGIARPPEGSFFIHAVPTGTYTFSAVALGYQPFRLDNVVVPLGATVFLEVPLMSLRPDEAGTVRGTVTLAGLPVPGVLDPPLVEVSLLQGDAVVASVVPDAVGRYLIDGVPQGTYALLGSFSFLSVRRDDVEVTGGLDTTVDLEIASPLPLGNISGVVTNAISGEPVSGASIQFILRLDLNRDGIPDIVEPFTLAVSGSDGAYTTRVLAGTQTLAAVAPGFAPHTETDAVIVAGQNTVVDFWLSPLENRPPFAAACWVDLGGGLVCLDPNSATVVPFTAVQLDGRQSGDLERHSLSYSWRLAATPARSAAAISDPTSVEPTLFVDLVGDYRVCLTVTDSLGLTSDEACVTVHVA
jgi:hypothetical protein